MSSSRQRWVADSLLAFIAFIWGSTFIIVKQALVDMSPAVFLSIRFSAAAVLLAVAFRGRAIPPPGERAIAWKAGVLTAIALMGGYILQTVGLVETTASKAGFITGFYVPLVLFFQMFVFKNGRMRVAWPRPMEALGILVATVGLVLLTLPEEKMTFSMGDGLVALGAVAFAIQILLVARYGGRVRFESLAVIQIAVSAAMAAIAIPFVDHPARSTFSAPVGLALVVSAVFATAVAFGVQSWAQQHTTPTRTALIFALEPVFAWAVAYWAAGETLSPRAAIGGVAILAGILLVELKPAATAGHPLERADA